MTINKTFIERRVYSGAPVRRGYRVKGIKLEPCEKGELPAELCKVGSLLEYSAGCNIHRGGCFGHMCVTPTGCLLPPQSLSFRSGDIRTQYYLAASKAFLDDPSDYRDQLAATNKGKYGHLRSVMSTPVSGSARLVCTPHDDENPRVVFVSENLASKVLYCGIEEYPDGTTSSTYTERSLREGDYVVLERPPSLSIFNNQPLEVRFWDKDCLGIHPKVFSFFHGDYDGDEGHIYVLGNPKSIREAREWTAPLDDKLQQAQRYMEETYPSEYGESSAAGDLKFLRYTTLSFDEIKSGDCLPSMGNWTRNKTEHLRMLRERIVTSPGTSTFLQDSIKGVKDIMRQQVNQGKIGDMSRIARISAMCFFRDANGGTKVVSRKSVITLNEETPPTTGCPSVRCVMSLCQASQEAALHAHRVGSVESAGVDLIENLLKGRLEGGKRTACSTLYVVNSTDIGYVRESLSASWCCALDDVVVAIAQDNAGDNSILEKVCGAYSPVVLARLPQQKRKSVCKRGVHVVFNYYGLRVEAGDIDDMVEMYCYRVADSTLPVTTRDGMMSRNLGWTETLMACEYGSLPQLTGSYSSCDTVTSAVMMSNFSRLHRD